MILKNLVKIRSPIEEDFESSTYFRWHIYQSCALRDMNKQDTECFKRLYEPFNGFFWWVGEYETKKP